MSAFFQLTLGKLRELLREPEALFWVFVFPVLLALALGIAFRSGGDETLPIGVQEGNGADWLMERLAEAPELQARRLDAASARRELSTGNVALVVIPGEPWTYWLDPTRPDSRLAELTVNDVLQRAVGRQDPRPTARLEMNEKGSRYIDFLIPGLLGMNLMGTGMWGIGFYIVNSRAGKLLKRMVATPMRRTEYLLAQIAGRLVFLIFEVGVLVAFAWLVFDVPVRGSILTLSAISVLGALTFGGMGLLVAARPRTIEGVSGLMNFVMLPMWVCSGTFFSTGRFPDAVQPFVQALPLTAVNDALRAVMLEGRPLLALWGEIVVIAVWGVGSFGLALRLFRWT